MEILSRGILPPKQTLEGFYAGESVPVNQALSDIFIKLHITEHTGRGIPKITEIYGKDTIHIRENSIVVTIPYERLGDEVYAPERIENVQVGSGNAPVGSGNAPIAKTEAQKIEIILEFCVEPKGITEIMRVLGYKDKRSVRKILNPLIEAGRVARTIPEKPNSKIQKYITIR